MLFSSTQIAVLQTGLMNYQLGKRQDGKKMSWRAIAERINIFSKTLPTLKGDSGKSKKKSASGKGKVGTEPLKGEALRRFVNGESELIVARLELVNQFLLHERMLDATDLDDRQEALRGLALLQESIANLSFDARRALYNIGPQYQNMQVKDGGYTERVTLTFELQDDNYVKVEERVEQLMTRFPTDRRAHKETRLKFVRRGFGFAVTRHNLLHVFVNGTYVDGLVSYVQVGEVGKGEDHKYIWLLRSGEDMPGMVSYHDSSRAVQTTNLRYFQTYDD